jgi:hypothetical protein
VHLDLVPAQPGKPVHRPLGAAHVPGQARPPRLGQSRPRRLQGAI